MTKLTVGLFFGGRSTEHEVSVVSALQAYEHLDKDKYNVIPIYVSKRGQFFSHPKFLHLKNYRDLNALILSSAQLVPANKNDQGGFLQQGLFKKFKPIDVAFPLFHGSFGEDGSVQGLFEMYQIPYVGFNVLGSAVAMDKVTAKAIFQQLGLPIGKFYQVKRIDWLKDPQEAIKQIKKYLKFPLFVKPATGGSSIGANRASDEDSLSFAIEVAAVYSEKILIEEAFEDVIEVNCSALGYEEVRASVCEQPVSSGELLSFADKYMRGGGKQGGRSAGGMETLSRIIPAPISSKLTKQIQEATIKIFKAFDGCGVARVDYFVEKKAVRSSRSEAAQDDTSYRFWVNEVNSPPGSLAFYLWEKSGISYRELLDTLIELALKRKENQDKTQYVFESGLLSQMAVSGGSKAGKR